MAIMGHRRSAAQSVAHDVWVASAGAVLNATIGPPQAVSTHDHVIRGTGLRPPGARRASLDSRHHGGPRQRCRRLAAGVGANAPHAHGRLRRGPSSQRSRVCLWSAHVCRWGACPGGGGCAAAAGSVSTVWRRTTTHPAAPRPLPHPSQVPVVVAGPSCHGRDQPRGAVRSGVSELRRVTLRVRVSRRRRHPRSTARCCAPGCPVASPPATHMRCHRARRTVAGAAWVRPHVQQPRRRAVTCFEQGAGGPVGFPWERGPTQHPEPQTLNPP